MWHEARKQEKKIRGLMVDFKKRAERRREFYEKIKADPSQFLRIYGRPYKIHYDPAIAMAAEGPQSMMPWQGNADNLIDRFDVRAHLDVIPDFKPKEEELSYNEKDEERKCSYESYRTLVENECAGLAEEQCLQQIYIDEQFGAIQPIKTFEEEERKRKLAEQKAAIGYTYEDSTPVDQIAEESESDTDVEMADLDVTLDVDALTEEQETILNQCGQQYGMQSNDYIRLLRKDKEELEALRMARLLEEEKAQYAGRKSRRERRAYKEKQLQGRKLSPPSYAARESPKYEPYKRSSSSSRSRSHSPEAGGNRIMFINSFGGESEGDIGIIQGPSLPPSDYRQTDRKSRSKHNARRKHSRSRHSSSRYSRSSSRSRSEKYKRQRRRRSYSRSYSRSRSRSRSRDRSRNGRSSRSYKSYSRRSHGRRSYSRSRSRSRSKSRSSSYSRSRSSRSSSLSKSRSRSRSRSSYRSSSRSRSKSPSPKPVIKRYRRASLSSKSSDSESDEHDKRKAEKGKAISCGRSLQGAAIGKDKDSSQNKLTLKEKLKRRMQAAINKQYKADKKAEIVRLSKKEQERQERADELRLRALEMRRKEREKRHRDDDGIYSSDGRSSSDESRSRSSVSSKKSQRPKSPRPRSRSPLPRLSQRQRSPIHRSPRPKSHRRSRSRSRSRSPRRFGRSRLVDY